MPDSTTGTPQIPKRQRNLVAFSLGVLMIGWAPTNMQSSFSLLGIQFSAVDPSYMWAWAVVINSYLYIAWIYTSRAEDGWLFWRGPKFNTLLRNKDHYWLRFFVPRGLVRFGVRPETFNPNNKRENLVKAVKVYEMNLPNRFLYRDLMRSPNREMFISEEQFKSQLWFPAKKRGYPVKVIVGRHKKEPFWLLMEGRHSGNPKEEVRQLLKELYFSILPPILLGAVGILTATLKLWSHL